MKKLSVLMASLFLAAVSASSHASFAKELLACEWSSTEYLLLRVSLPRSGPGYYYVESVTADGKREIAKFEDDKMDFMHSSTGGNSFRQLSSAYFLNDGRFQFLAHYFKAANGETPSGIWLVNLDGYRTPGLTPTSCTDCETDNNYCRDLFEAESNPQE